MQKLRVMECRGISRSKRQTDNIHQYNSGSVQLSKTSSHDCHLLWADPILSLKGLGKSPRDRGSGATFRPPMGRLEPRGWSPWSFRVLCILINKHKPFSKAETTGNLHNSTNLLIQDFSLNAETFSTGQ